MTRALFYGTTSRMAKDAMHYLVFPMVMLGAYSATKDYHRAKVIASTTVAGLYGLLTTRFAGEEAAVLDNNVREAVAAEFGKDPKDIKFSDYWDSENSIVAKERHDLVKITGLRSMVISLFLLPLVGDALSMAFPNAKFAQYLPGHGKPAQGGDSLRRKTSNSWEAFNSGVKTVGWEHIGYGAMSAYWIYETYGVPKTGMYEIVKLLETSQSTAQRISPNQIFSLYQRSREDQGHRMLDEKEREQCWPLFEKLTKLYNERDSFGMPELIYLLGFNKINVQDKSGAITPEAIAQSEQEIDKVATIGLKGIREENRLKRAQLSEKEKPKSFVEKIGRKAIDVGYGFSQHFVKKANVLRPEEWVSSRDPQSSALMR